MYEGVSEIDTVIKIFQHQGTPQYDKFLNIEDYTHITQDFKVKFPKFKPKVMPQTSRKDKIPEDFLKIIAGMTCIDPLKRMTC